MKRFIRVLSILLVLLTLFPFFSALAFKEYTINATDYPVEKSGKYTSMEEVAVYLATFKKLPSNYITKSKARDFGWNSGKSNLWDVTDRCSIGGDRFNNYGGTLPEGQWTECDIDYDGRNRNAKRIVFSKDCSMIFYTYDHYNTFWKINVDFSLKAGEPSPYDVTQVEESGLYDQAEEVAEYIHQFGHLPDNYITREEAQELGWTSKKDNLGELLPGASIGGDRYYNREKRLPDKEGRIWYECDVNTVDGKRSKHRIAYSSDGLIFFTSNKYKTVDQVY